jgi:hypothetical protein
MTVTSFEKERIKKKHITDLKKLNNLSRDFSNKTIEIMNPDNYEDDPMVFAQLILSTCALTVSTEISKLSKAFSTDDFGLFTEMFLNSLEKSFSLLREKLKNEKI